MQFLTHYNPTCVSIHAPQQMKKRNKKKGEFAKNKLMEC